jgi:hypothetical protein
MENTRWVFEHPAETVVTVVILAVIATAAVALAGIAVIGAIERAGRRRPSTRSPEVLFVGRWGLNGPELFRVGKKVRRLADPAPEGTPAWPGESGSDAVAFARRILAEVMWQRPATKLAHAFAEALLAPLRVDGFVLSASDVEDWLDNPHRRSEQAETDGPPGRLT